MGMMKFQDTCKMFLLYKKLWFIYALYLMKEVTATLVCACAEPVCVSLFVWHLVGLKRFPPGPYPQIDRNIACSQTHPILYLFIF